MSEETPKTDHVAVRAALIEARAVSNTIPYDAIAALQVVRRLAALAPTHIAPIAEKAEQAVVATIGRSGTTYDALACYALARLVTEMERTLFRIVD